MKLTTILLATCLAILPASPAFASRTTATYYSDVFQGRRMANGQRFSQSSNSVATNQYKLGTRVKICHKQRCVTGVVRDRCNCGIDLSKQLFKQIAPLKRGRVPVKVYRY